MDEQESNQINQKQLPAGYMLLAAIVVGVLISVVVHENSKPKFASVPKPAETWSDADRRWAEENAKKRRSQQENWIKIHAETVKQSKKHSAKTVSPKAVEAPSAVHAIEKRPGEWYQGGNLHNVSPAEWKRGTYENRLATAGDFVSGFYNNGKLKLPVHNMDDIKTYSIQLETAISKALDMSPEMIEKLSGQSISKDVALPLILAMDWLK